MGTPSEGRCTFTNEDPLFLARRQSLQHPFTKVRISIPSHICCFSGAFKGGFVLSFTTMSDFIFDVSSPAIDHHMISLIDPQLTFAASGNNQWKDQHVRQLGWNVVDLPDDLFSSSEHAATIRRLFLVFQGAIQYCKFREQQATFEVGQTKSKLKASKKELSELFDELVELREATALMKIGRNRQNRGAAASHREADDRRETLEERRGFSCYLCGNMYPSAGPLQSHLKKRHSISAELAQKASARCGVDVYQTAIELQKNEILREREESRVRELNDLKTEVTHVRLAMSDMAAKQGTEAHREIEFSREVLATSIQQVQQILAAAAVAASTPPPPQAPQPVHVVLTQQQPSRVQQDEILLTKLEMQDRRVRELEAQLQSRKTSTPIPAVVAADIKNNNAPQSERSHTPTSASIISQHTREQSKQQGGAAISSLMRRVSKRYDEVSEDDQSSSIAGSPEGKKIGQPSDLRDHHNEGRSLLAPVPILLKLPRSPTVATGQPTSQKLLDRPLLVSDDTRQSSSTIEETKSLVSPISASDLIHTQKQQQQQAPAEQHRSPMPSLTPPPPLVNSNVPASKATVDTTVSNPQASAEHLSEFVNVEVSQMSLPSKKEGGGNDAANRSDTVNMESQRVSVDGPIVSSASSTTNHNNTKASSTTLQRMNQQRTSSSSDSSDSSSSSSSDDSSSDDEKAKNSTAAAPPAEAAVKTKVKKPSLFSRIIAKVTS